MYWPAHRRFTLVDYHGKLKVLVRENEQSNVFDRLPGLSKEFKANAAAGMKHEVKRVMGIIDAMTMAERNEPSLIESGRCRRIAVGAGVSADDVKELVKQFLGARKMFERLENW